VVIACVNGFPYIGECLDSVYADCPDAEVTVADCTNRQTRERIWAQWPSVRVIAFDTPASVAELRANGIAASSAPCVAVIEDHCVVERGWAAALLAGHAEGYSAVGGPIYNRTRRVRDWAAFLFEYSAYMRLPRGGPVTDLSGMNVSYDRRAIAAIGDLLSAGKWEWQLHGRLRERGFALFGTPAAALGHIKDFGVREFMAQRFHYARAHAAMLNPDLGWKRIVYALGSPALVPLLYARIARNVRRYGHAREFVLATPLLALYLAATALGEGLGYAFGGGRSLLRVK
jgi:hypothetical protein